MHCKVFEDNRSCISIACGQKVPQELNILQSSITISGISSGEESSKIFSIDWKKQTTDISTKLLNEDLFVHLRKMLNGQSKDFEFLREC